MYTHVVIDWKLPLKPFFASISLRRLNVKFLLYVFDWFSQVEQLSVSHPFVESESNSRVLYKFLNPILSKTKLHF